MNRTFEVRSPATGEVIGAIADHSAGDAARIAEMATQAFETWKRTTPFERSEILLRWCELILQNQEGLAGIMTQEMGKPIREARGEVKYAADFVKWYAEEAKRIHGETFASPVKQKRLMTIKQPVGPVFAVTPWNFPAAMVTRKAAPALAAGCTFVLKPAEQTPLSALRLQELWQEAGGPPGTLQVVPALDPVPIADALIGDPRIRKVTFTGSTEVGKILYEKSAKTVKRVSLELGGHAPFIVFAGADVDQAVQEAIACKFRNAGQTCVCTNRIYVQRDIVGVFADKYVAATRKLRVGDPLRDDTDVGPLVDARGRAKVERHVRDALDKGAKLLAGGRALRGLYFEPTVLLDVSESMQIMQEETFGPVAPLITFDSEEEVVRLANDTPFGLAAYLYTKDLAQAFEVSEALEYGIIGVNDGMPSAPHAPFGGIKESGLGREGCHWGIDEYLEVKYISLGVGR
ncbi:MAG TPA: NAD-dependent succinate-semialdehyde dehydrogenase [Trueperaceae bacterium]